MSRQDVTEVFQGASLGFTVSNITDPRGELITDATVTASLIYPDGTEETGAVTDNGDGTYYAQFEPSQRGFAQAKLRAEGDDSAWEGTYSILVKRF